MNEPTQAVPDKDTLRQQLKKIIWVAMFYYKAELNDITVSPFDEEWEEHAKEVQERNLNHAVDEVVALVYPESEET